MAADNVTRITAILSAVADLRGFQEFENRLGASANTIEKLSRRINRSLASLGGGLQLDQTLSNLNAIESALNRIVNTQRRIGGGGGGYLALPASPSGPNVGQDFRRQEALIDRLIDRVERRGQIATSVATSPTGTYTGIGATAAETERRAGLQRELNQATQRLARAQTDLAIRLEQAEKFVNSRGFAEYANRVQQDAIHALSGFGDSAGTDRLANFVPNADERRTGVLSPATVRRFSQRNVLGGAGDFEEVASVLQGRLGVEGAGSYQRGRGRGGQFTQASAQIGDLKFAPSRNEIVRDYINGATGDLDREISNLESRVRALRAAVGSPIALGLGVTPRALVAPPVLRAIGNGTAGGTRYLQQIAAQQRFLSGYQQATAGLPPPRFTAGSGGITGSVSSPPPFSSGRSLVPYIPVMGANGTVTYVNPTAGPQNIFGSPIGGGGGGYPGRARPTGYGGGPPPFAGGAGGGGGFFGDFKTGFRGRGDRPYGEQIGQAFKFSVFYGTAYAFLFQITNALQASVQEALKFEEALVGLNIATGETRDANKALADQLGSAAAAYGLSPSVGVEVGARSIGLFGLQDASRAQQQAAGLAQTQVVGQLALTTGQKPEDIQRTLAAISQSFKTGYQGSSRVADLDAFLTREYGQQPGTSLETLSQVGTLGVSAGFSPELIAAIASKVQSQTGQTPTAVAGLLSQFFTRAGEGNLNELFGEYGIDRQQDLYSQVAQLSTIYQGLNGPGQQRINAAFGRGRSQGAAGIILGNFGNLQAAAGDAEANAAGASASRAQEVLNSIPGQIKLLVGALKELAKDVGESGLLGVLGLAALALKEVVQGIDGFVKVVNLIPEPLRVAALAVAGLAAASVLLGRTAGFSSRAAVGSPVGTLFPTSLSGGYAAARLGGASVGRAAAGVGMAALGGPIGLTVIGLTGLAIAAGNAKKTFDNIAAADVLTKDALRGANTASTVEELRNSASFAANAASAQRTARSGLFGFVGATADSSGALDTTSAYLTNRAAAVQAEQERKAASQSVGVFQGGSIAELTTGLELLTAQGVSAAEQFNLLADALFNAEAAATQFSPEQFTTDAVGQLFGITSVTQEVVLGRGGARGTETPTFQKNVLDGLDPNKRQAATDAILNKLKTTRPDENGLFTPEALNAIAQAGVDSLGLTPEKAAELQKAFVVLLRQQLPTTFAQNRQLSPEEAVAQVGLLRSAESTTLAQLPRGSSGRSRIVEMRKTLGALRSVNDASGGNVGSVLLAIEDQKQAIAEAMQEESTTLRLALQRKAKTSAEIKEIGGRFLKSDIRRAVAARDAQLLAQIIGQAGNAGVRIAINAINAAIVAARAAAAVHAKIRAVAGKLAAIDGIAPSVPTAGQDEASEKVLRDLRRIANSTDPIGGGNNYADPFGDSGGGGGADKPSAAQIRAARQTAEAQRRGGDVGLARAALATAAADMAKAKKGTIEFYSALGAYYDAQEGLREALRSYQLNKKLLRIDITDPIAEARANLQAARQKARQDRRRGASPDLIAADDLDVRRQQAALEGEKFNRWLSDLQTNQRLRRITNAQFLASIEKEIDHLQRVKKRTRQQQEELNQLEEILQAAKESMAGQFNLGDIKLPTPYEARRLVQAQLTPGGGVAGPGGSTTLNTIYIDGSDTGAVLNLIRQVLGPAAVQTASTAPRRG